MKTIIINENQVDFIKSNKKYIENNSAKIFNKEVRNFIYNLINGEISTISDYWRINGIKKNELFDKLKKYGIITIGENEKILIPKKNFDNKINRLYYELFPEQEPGLIISEDDGGGAGFGGDAGAGDGATTSSSSGSYEIPIFGKPIRRKFTK